MPRSLASVLLAWLFVAACSNKGGTNSAKSNLDLAHPVKGDWVVVRFENEPDSLNPLIATTGVSHYALWGANNSQIYELLMAYNTKDWGLTEPLLIEEPPAVSKDHLTYTLRVRDGVRWHDGSPSRRKMCCSPSKLQRARWRTRPRSEAT